MITETFSSMTAKMRDRLMGRREVRNRVLCADDDESVRTYCSSVLARAGYDVDQASNGREVLDRVGQTKYAAVVMDLSMPYVHGSTVLSIFGQSQPEMLRRLVVITGLNEAALAGMYGSVAALLHKPVSGDALVQAVEACIDAGLVATQTTR